MVKCGLSTWVCQAVFAYYYIIRFTPYRKQATFFKAEYDYNTKYV